MTILENPLYYGRWVYGRTVDRESVVWDIDNRRERVVDDFYDPLGWLWKWLKKKSDR